jgi:hypothetical protein
VTVDEFVCRKCGQSHAGPPLSRPNFQRALDLWTTPGELPCAELEPTDHPLAVEQRTGITVARVREIAALIAHGDAA